MGDIGDAACHFILDLILIDFENVCAIAYQVLIIATAWQMIFVASRKYNIASKRTGCSGQEGKIMSSHFVSPYPPIVPVLTVPARL